MTKKPRGRLVAMAQSVPGFGPNDAATPDEIAFGHSKRQECGTPARMRATGDVLVNLPNRAHECGGWAPTSAELIEARRAGAMLQREADRWEAERWIDST